jgi:hypothetical protein
VGLAAQVRRRPLERGLVDVDQHQVHAFGGEALGHGPADAAGGARDERGLALEGVHRSPRR